jgi:ABC-type amino acid transport system permease subunit
MNTPGADTFIKVFRAVPALHIILFFIFTVIGEETQHGKVRQHHQF